jgi:iron-sulfur cluster repair protein YtfE (RIC family)
MKITDAFLGEHGVFYAQFDYLEAEAWRMERLAEVRACAAMLAAALIPHAEMENDLLFAALEGQGGDAGPTPVMRAEHREIEEALLRARDSRELDDARDLLRFAVEQARDHFAKEEQVLFPIAEQLLGAEALHRLGEEWARRRRVHAAAAPAMTGARR